MIKLRNTRRGVLRAIFSLTLCLCVHGAPAQNGNGGVVDMLEFGNAESERAHAMTDDKSEVVKSGLDEPARRLLPLKADYWEGGRLAFTLQVSPNLPNYFTIRLWGGEANRNRLILFCEGKQVGYRHLGDIDLLDVGTDEPAYNGRFYYTTTPLPVEMTRGKNELRCEIRAIGPIWGYGDTFEKYQKPMTEPSRGIYRVYTHTDGCFVPPAGEKQGEAPANPPVRTSPGPEVLDQLKQRVNRELEKDLASKTPLNQMQFSLLARAYHVKWCAAYRNPKVAEQVIKGADKLYLDYRKDKKVAEFGPATYNPDWFGVGPIGEGCSLLSAELAPRLDETIAEAQVTRRAGWSEMLQYSRDWHLRHRRLYTNQSMINDLYAYLANRGVAAIDPAKAMPEEKMRAHLYESIGLQPWLGSETPSGPALPVGNDYLQLTAKGLTKELGYVGYYGEVLDWISLIYDATRPAPCEPGDPKIKEQLEKCMRARSVFRYPMLDTEGFRAMRIETIVGWRDSHFPGGVCYAERMSWDGAATLAPALTQDSHAVGYVQQMFEDNQFFASIESQMKSGNTFRITAGFLGVPDQYEALKAQPPSKYRLPMAPGQPDFVFSDEEDGVVAVKNGDGILYASLYWRARNAVNFLARVHYSTPRYDRVAVVRQQTEFEPSGMTYQRPDWINFGFAKGGLKYPGGLHSAHAGEKLPIAKIPEGIKFKAGDESVYAGKGSFYTLRYGDYLVGMNMTADKTFELKPPEGFKEARNLVSGNTVAPGAILSIPPRSTAVLWFGGKVSSAHP